MKVDLQKVVDFIRKKAGETELEGFRREKENPELSSSCFAQAFAIEEVANQIEVTAEILDDPKENKDSISIVWSIEDIHHVAEDIEVKLTDEQARDILLRAKDSHDASVGIDWNTLEYLINDYIEDINNNV